MVFGCGYVGTALAQSDDAPPDVPLWPGATATVSAADRRRAEQKARAEAAVLSEYQTAEDELDAGWDAEEVKEMSKKYKAFLKESKAKKWWGGGD